MFQLNYRDNRPIYEQLKEQLRKLIVTGVLKSDEKLPSIREIASSLAINPNTIQRAYRELESEGYVYTIAGKGSFAAPRQDIDDRREKELLQQFDTIVLELSYLGYQSDSLFQRITNLIEKGEQS
ncbi:MAG: GntR family transcriptional regulator [Lachnospiraceae bacterium]|nr:GntR family transcriptional regulator [Lachnospiraceae bacterium]